MDDNKKQGTVLCFQRQTGFVLHPFNLMLFLPVIDSNCPCSFISSCAANYFPAPFPVLCCSGGLGRAQLNWRRGRPGGEKGRVPVLWHRHKGIPCTGLCPPTRYSHPVWLPDTLAFTHTPVCTAEGETGRLERKKKSHETVKFNFTAKEQSELETWKELKFNNSGRCSITSVSSTGRAADFLQFYDCIFFIFTLFFVCSSTEKHLEDLQPVDQDTLSQQESKSAFCSNVRWS